MRELPHERDGAVVLVADVPSRPETPERALVGSQSREQDDVRALREVIDVALARLTRHSGGGLALPVDQLTADRVVAVAGCR